MDPKKVGMAVFTKDTPANTLLATGATTVPSQIVLHADGNLETTHLLEQVCFCPVRSDMFSTCSSLKTSGVPFAS